MLNFYKGMDVSFLQQYECEGMVIRDRDGTPTEAFSLAKKYEVNAIRLRIWNEPENVPESGGWCSLKHTVEMAKRIKASGLDFLLDFHYSDYWADPGKQNKPAAWKELSFEQLKKAVFDYTRNVISELRDAGAMPDMVQIGNEIRSGFLFPDGEVPNWKGLVELLNSGIAGARAAGGDGLSVMIHLDQGGRYNYLREWFDKAIETGLDFEDVDVIGISYYPFWHGTFADLKNSMEKLAERYKKPIIIAETAHAWRNSAQGFIDDAQEKISGIDATPQGQRKLLELVMSISASLPDNMGRGIFYWEPFCIPRPGEGGWAENMGLLDESGKVLEGIHAFEFRPQNADFSLPAKIYAPETVFANSDGTPELPDTLQVLLYDGTIDSRCATWEAGAMENCFTGHVEGTDETVTVKVEDKTERSENNLIRDPNWNDGFVYWECLPGGDYVNVDIIPEFVDPFPAPPVNAVKIESIKNFTFELSQQVTVPHAGRWILHAQYRGTDTTGVEVSIFLKSEQDVENAAQKTIHPVEHEWQDVTVELDVKAECSLCAGLRIAAPPVYGMVRGFSLSEVLS